MIRRLRVKFICVNMLIVTLMLTVIFGMLVYFTHSDLREDNMRKMSGIMGMHRSFGRNPDHNNRPDDHGEPWRNEFRTPYAVAKIRTEGEMEIDTGRSFDLWTEETILEAVSIAQKEPEKNGVIYRYRIRFAKQNVKSGTKIYLMDISRECQMLTDLIANSLLVGGLSLCVFLGISIVLARWAIHPVEQAWKQQKQFVADASHELKTPLAVIMTNAELLQNPQYSQTETRQFSSGILSMSRQMRGLVEGLLELARADNETLSIQMEQLDLSAVAEACVLLFEPVYFENGLQLESDLEESCRIRGSESHIRQVLEILLDNGVKYASQGSCARLCLKKQGGRCLLSMATAGDPISPEDLKKIFDRFYRIDKARAMNQSYGLGLSIAQSIVRSHGGKIWAESEQGINTFYILLDLMN